MDSARGTLGGLLAIVLAWSSCAGQEPLKPTPSASESRPNVPAPGHSVHGEAYDEGPRQPARPLPGQGQVDFDVTTSVPEARAFVNQGVAQIHTFYYFEAERSFRQAAKLDPSCAMAYWGMALANTGSSPPNFKRIKGFLEAAVERQQSASARERLYIQSLNDAFREGMDEKARRQSYLSGLERIVQEHPEDLDARAWMAMAAWQEGSFGSRQAVDIVLDTVLAKNPMHPGAHHYRIHLWDGTSAARAESSAKLYAKAAPGIAHAWHMPGHTYTELRRYDDAAYQQEGSARVDHAAMARDRIMPFQIHNYAHNNQWLATTLAHLGRAREALAMGWNLVDQPRDPNQNGPNDGGSAQRSGRARVSEILCRFELWDELIDATNSGTLDWSDNPLERKERAYTLGQAFAARGDLEKLREQIAALRAIAEADQKSKPAPTGGTPQPSPESPEILELEGHERLLTKDLTVAFDRFAKAGRMRPESLARAHVSARNYGFAVAAAKKACESNPGQFPALACLVETLDACEQRTEAQASYEKLSPFLARADRDTPIMRRLRALTAQWEESGWRPPDATPTAPESDRADLTALGPLDWAPFPAETFSLVDTNQKTRALEDFKGKNVLAIFFLGGSCAHCLQQLQEFGKHIDAFRSLNVEILAISTDSLDSCQSLVRNTDGAALPMPILADPELDVFRRFHAFDAFEGRPLHGTFLIDARGDIRFQRISADPFLDVEFVKTEAARVNRLVARTGDHAALDRETDNHGAKTSAR